MVDNMIFIVIAHFNFILVILSFLIESKCLLEFANGINFVIIVTCIIKDIFINKNSKVSKLEFKERVDILLKKENIKDERKNDTRESN